MVTAKSGEAQSWKNSFLVIKNRKSARNALFQSISEPFKDENMHRIPKTKKSLSNKSGQAQSKPKTPEI
jgi:hypothetical protein